MIHWIQEATQAWAQTAASSWPSAILSGGIVGAVVGLVGVFVTQYLTQRRHSQTLEQTAELEAQRANKAAELEAQRAHEAAIQRYFEQVGKLLIDNPLHEATPEDNLITVVRAQTLAVLSGLDPERKHILLQFLYEPNLIRVDNPILRLGGANLSGADLRMADLSNCNLVETNLSRAVLSRTNLRWANLSGAEGLTQEQINQAIGDEHTKLPDHLQRPAHWTKSSPEEGEE